MSGTVTVHRTFFREVEIHEGDYMGGPSTYTDTTVEDGLSAREAVDLIKREGLTFEATGGAWAANPDGSRELYRTPFGREGDDWREEVSAHLSEFPDRVAVAIANAVDQKEHA